MGKQPIIMTQTYKYSRNSWENQEKAIFDGVGMYDIPVIEPEEYHHVEDTVPLKIRLEDHY